MAFCPCIFSIFPKLQSRFGLDVLCKCGFIDRKARLHMKPTQIKRFCANRASRADALWLRHTLNREDKNFGIHVELDDNDTLRLLRD
jgi:hypothetical protein